MLSLSLLLACSTASAPGAATGEPAATSAPVVETAPVAAVESHPEPVAAAPGATHFGSAFTVPDASVIPAASFLASTAQYVGQTVRIEGRVADVCQKAGCWMVIAEGDKTLRIRMKEHGFSVAKDGAGALACVEGTVVEITVDPATAEHFASEATPGAALPETAATAGKVYEIEATAVELKRS